VTVCRSLFIYQISLTIVITGVAIVIERQEFGGKFDSQSVADCGVGDDARFKVPYDREM
jgi:hypothetical protein